MILRLRTCWRGKLPKLFLITFWSAPLLPDVSWSQSSPATTNTNLLTISKPMALTEAKLALSRAPNTIWKGAVGDGFKAGAFDADGVGGWLSAIRILFLS